MFPHGAFIKTAWILLVVTALATGSGTGLQGSQDDNVIEGFGGNRIAAGIGGGTISGGGQVAFPNQVLRDFGVIGGGRGNTAGNLSTVGGGDSNTADGIRATIGGGANNTASRNSAVVAGGFANTASQSYATVGGGNLNVANDMYTTISGGSGNLAAGRISTVGGGTRNQALSAYATIGGGTFNIAYGGTSTVAGGTQNHADGIGSFVGGGAGNMSAGFQSTVAGGLGNQSTDNYSVIAGGRANLAGNGGADSEDAPYASVGGGYGNQAGGAYATVPGGYENQALGDHSFAAGNRAQVDADHPGAVLFADSSDFVFLSVAPDEFAARATGGVRFVTAIDGDGAPLAGIRLAKGSGSWETLSDRDAKTSISPVNGTQVLEALLDLPISTWQYTGQPGSVKHIGPVAQDFYAAFRLGQDDRYIASVDADGVALAAIQGMYQVLQEKDARIRALSAENADQRQQIQALDERISRLERGKVGPNLLSNWVLFAGTFLGAGFFFGRKKSN